jgi:hypothetical protein
MKDLITQLFTQFAWFKADSGSEFSGSETVEFARKNNLIGTKLTGKDGTQYRINTSSYYYRGQQRESLWVNPISDKEIESDAMTVKYALSVQ